MENLEEKPTRPKKKIERYSLEIFYVLYINSCSFYYIIFIFLISLKQKKQRRGELL